MTSRKTLAARVRVAIRIPLAGLLIAWLTAALAPPLQAAAAEAREVRVVSPDGHVAFTLRTDGGALTWRVSFHGAPAIEASRLRLLVDQQDLGARVTLGAVTRDQRDERYPLNGGHAEAHDRSNGARVSIAGAGGRTFTVEIRVFDDGVGFRTVVPGEGRRVVDEQTMFRVPSGSTVWYHDLYWHYEGQHVARDIADVPAGDWAAPPLTIALPPRRAAVAATTASAAAARQTADSRDPARAERSGGYAVITEAALMHFSGMALQADGRRGFVSRLGHAQPVSYPFAWDYTFADAARLAAPAAIDGPITTPWRVVLLSPDLDGLVNSDVITNLSPPPDPALFPQGARTPWIKPGRSTWLWLDGGARTVEGVKAFSDLASQLGFEYNVVDAFWSRWTDEQIRDLVDYSKARGVGIWLWKHGRDIKDRDARRAFFKRCQDLGVVGVKLDAFSHEAKEFIDLYQDSLRDAAEFQLLVNIHGSNKPTGEARSWPNELAREGIRGLEYRGSQAAWARHNVTLPFTRLLADTATTRPSSSATDGWTPPPRIRSPAPSSSARRCSCSARIRRRCSTARPPT